MSYDCMCQFSRMKFHLIFLILTHCVFLQAAGNAVKRASDNLVKAAQKAAFDAEDDQAVVVKSKMVGGIAQVRQRSQTKLEHKYKHEGALSSTERVFSCGFMRM